MATHPDFPKLLMDMEIMVDGEARNAIRAIDMLFEAVRMKIIKETNISEDSNAQILTFKEAQIDEDEYFEMKIKNDLRPNPALPCGTSTLKEAREAGNSKKSKNTFSS